MNWQNAGNNSHLEIDELKHNEKETHNVMNSIDSQIKKHNIEVSGNWGPHEWRTI
jgi:hypothetical protein